VIGRSRETETREPVRLVEPDRCAGSSPVSRGVTMVEPGTDFGQPRPDFRWVDGGSPIGMIFGEPSDIFR
jgi:hypothetical protein